MRWLCIIAVLLTGCVDEHHYAPPTNTVEHTVAMVLPPTQEHKELAEWAVQNINSAQTDIRLRLEWHDGQDFAALGRRLQGDDKICAVVGPLHSADVQTMSEAMYAAANHPKPLFAPVASSAELIRKFAYSGNVVSAQKGFLWALTESDISQCEVLLATAKERGARRVALVADDGSIYGKTFCDWFAFQAKELEMEAVGIFKQLPVDADADYLICAPSTGAELQEMLAARGDTPMLFADWAFDPEYLSFMQGAEGVAPYADPSTGFEVAFHERFGRPPYMGEAQIYDALMLAALALYVSEEGENLNDALRRVVSGRVPAQISWQGEGLRESFSQLQQGIGVDIKGASGDLEFDSKVFTNVLQTTYCRWAAYNGHYIIFNYATADSGNRTDDEAASWNWESDGAQEFDNTDAGIAYPPHTDNWAVLVAGSTGWQDYRHQADVLALYQMLKQNGYDDSRIILIMEDDIAYNPKNPHPGQVRTSPLGDNLYENVVRDYRLSELAPADLLPIMRGEASQRLPAVVQSGAGSNVLLFWSGHGRSGALNWGAADYLDRQLFEEMFSDVEFRKCLCLLEACYAGSMARGVSGKGVLLITAAGEFETSKADVVSLDLGVWMSNAFSRTLIETLGTAPAIPLRDLYYTLFRTTVGSHVTVYNDDNYGNLYHLGMREFVVPR